MADRCENRWPGDEKYVQRALNALNRCEVDYPDVRVSGKWCANTQAAWNAFLAKRGSGAIQIMERAIEALKSSEHQPKDNPQ